MEKEEAHFQEIIEREKGLHRGLSTRQLSMIAIGGAIGTGLFLGSGMAIGLAGPSVIFSYGIGAIIAFLLMGCLAEMTVAHPTSGSFGAVLMFAILITTWFTDMFKSTLTTGIPFLLVVTIGYFVWKKANERRVLVKKDGVSDHVK